MGMGSKVPAIIRLLLCSIFTVTTAYAGPVGLPDSARPGAVRPEQEGRAEIPSKPVSEVLEVPAVIDRPFDIDEGEAVVVTAFRLFDAYDLPEYDVSVDEIEALLRAQKALKTA